ncbi:uncharacterized protein LOC141856049 isoform X2 [Brevipalpus obovatus]|uniref:uncharacterized protein LOC141856049 isoform X2 n=1 Tax=Brevipalpus obovatus TaxID=246614 RepID=UPI003D9EFEB9
MSPPQTMVILKFKLKLILFMIILIHHHRVQSDSNSELISTSGWKSVDLREYPPKDDMNSYLYVIGSHDDPRILKIQFQGPPNLEWKQLQSIRIELQYWGYGGEPVNRDKKGTTLFRIAVVTCDQDKPTSKWASFEPDEYDPTKWNDLSFETPEFNLACYQRLDIMVLSSPSWATGTGKYLAAIRNVVITFKYKDITESLISSSASTTRSPIELEDIFDNESQPPASTTIPDKIFRCFSPNDCENYIIIPDKSWSNTGFPAATSEFNLARIPETQDESDTLMISIKPPDSNSDVCVTFTFWATEGTRLNVYFGSKQELKLGPSYSTDVQSKIIYQWYHVRFCLSHFYGQLDADHSFQLFMLGKQKNTKETDEMVAVGDINRENIQTVPMEDANFPEILSHWSKNSAQSEWYSLPSEVWEWREILRMTPIVNADSSIPQLELALALSIYNQSTGSAYLYSRWFRYSYEQSLRFSISWPGLSGAGYVEVSMYDEKFQRISEREYFLQEESTDDQMDAVFKPTNFVLGTVYRFQIYIEWIHNQQHPAEIIFTDVDMGDACRNGRATCHGHGECVLLLNQPDESFMCQCEPQYFGKYCERINWCEMYPTNGQPNGNQYCANGGGTCDRERFEYPDHQVCSCGAHRYWMITSTDGTGECIDLDPCAGLDPFCDQSHRCDSEPFIEYNPCTVCDGRFKYSPASITAMNTIKDGQAKACVKDNICHLTCGHTGCTVYQDRAICHRSMPLDHNDDTIKCDPLTQYTQACDHMCYENNSAIECQCLDGYHLTTDGRSCTTELSCDLDCGTNSKCVLHDLVPKCDCTNGHLFRDGVCEDVCSLNSKYKLTDTEATSLVRTICGTSECQFENNKIHCTCNSPNIVADNGLCTINRTCATDGLGFRSCAELNAICVPLLTPVGGEIFKCICPIGTRRDPHSGQCVEQCDAVSMGECQKNNAKCENSDRFGVDQYQCVCLEGFKKSSRNKDDGPICELIQHAIEVKLVMRVNLKSVELQMRQEKFKIIENLIGLQDFNEFCAFDNDRSGCIEYLLQVANGLYANQEASMRDATIRAIIIENLVNMKTVYGRRVEDIFLQHFEPITESLKNSGQDYRLTLMVELDISVANQYFDSSSSPSGGGGQFLGINANCLPYSSASIAHGYCLLGYDIVLASNSAVENRFLPCDRDSISKCPKNSVCQPIPYSSKFSCLCLPGYRAVSEEILQLDHDGGDKQSVRQTCEDIDECEQPDACPPHSYCINFIGSYACECEEGYFYDDNKRCIDVCDQLGCINGECLKSNHSFATCMKRHRAILWITRKRPHRFLWAKSMKKKNFQMQPLSKQPLETSEIPST